MMRPREMVDWEIKAELKLATGERRDALLAELDGRRAYRASVRFRPVDALLIGYRGRGNTLEDL
jgi:hypothetical protein